MQYQEHQFDTIYLDVFSVLSEQKKERLLTDLSRILAESIASLSPSLHRPRKFIIEITNDFRIYAANTQESNGVCRVVVSNGLVQYLYAWSGLTLALQKDTPPFDLVLEHATWLLDFFSAKSYGQYQTMHPGVSFGIECWIDFCGQLSRAAWYGHKNLSFRCTLSALAFIIAHEVAHATPEIRAQASQYEVDVLAGVVADIGYPAEHFDEQWLMLWLNELFLDYYASACVRSSMNELENMDGEYSLVYKKTP